MPEISRRNFLKGAGIGALGVVSAGALGACTSKETSSADASTSKLATSPADASYPWPADPPEIADADVEKEISCDVVVVGLGVAGCAAFRSAAEAGAKVVAFEKAATPQQRSSQYAYLNGPHSEAWGFPVWADQEFQDIIEDEVKNMSNMVKYDIWLRWARESAEVFEWYCKGVPNFAFPETAADFAPMSTGAASSDAAPGLSNMGGANPIADYTEDRTAHPITVAFTDHQAVLDGNVKTAEDLGAETYYGHFAEKLIMENGRCVGAYARNSETGKYVKATASKGVILTCGDYMSNTDMVRFFRPDVIINGNGNPWPNIDAEGNRTNTGDGYKLGYWAGASIQQVHAPMTHTMGGAGGPKMTMADSMGPMGAAPYLRLNRNGERFMNEAISNVECEYQINLQPTHQCLMFWDSKYPDYPQLTGLGPASEDSIKEFIDKGTCFKADTLEALLDAIGDIDKEKALKSIQHYNDEVVAKQYDAEFNKPAKYLVPLATGPFYAQLIGSALCLVILGGLESDKDAHVLDEERKIIPGLYVGGNIQGNRFAIKYPFKLGGASHCLAMFYGYVAGKNAAASA